MNCDDSCVGWPSAEAPAAAGGAQIIDGKMTAELIRKEIAVEAAGIMSTYGKASRAPTAPSMCTAYNSVPQNMFLSIVRFQIPT